MSRILSLLLAVLTLAGCTRAPAQELSAFMPQPEERLVIYTSHKESVYAPIIKEFEQRTGIWVEVQTGGTVTLLERIAAGDSDCDLLFGGGADSLNAYSSCFAPYTSPNADSIAPKYDLGNVLWTPFSSLTSYAANPVINFTIMFLIVFGGIGFLTWDDIRTNRLHLRKYRMQSKVILCTTAVLLIAPAMYFYFFEFDDLTRKERLLSSLFQAVTPRTAGFNTVELTDLSEAGQFITIALMLIGGSPGSTAGGLKTTTIAVLLTTAISTFRRRENANLFGRRIDDDVVKNAATISLMYITLCCTGGLIISVSEGLPMLTCLFETASAVGTVGLSLGITPELNLLSRSVLILLMFFGRVGGLTLIFAALSSAQKKVSKLPKEKITVG